MSVCVCVVGLVSCAVNKLVQEEIRWQLLCQSGSFQPAQKTDRPTDRQVSEHQGELSEPSDSSIIRQPATKNFAAGKPNSLVQSSAIRPTNQPTAGSAWKHKQQGK